MATIDFLASDDEADCASSSKRSRAARNPRNQNHEDDDNIDITASLLPAEPAPSAAAKPKSKAKAKANSNAASHPSSAGMVDAIDQEEHDQDAAFIAQVMQAQNVKAGAEVAKKTIAGKNKGKNKLASGVVSGGGSFQSMGLHPSLLRSLLLRGFTTPTPIQRQAIPSILAQPPRDVVGMARTGSGKTLAYLIPLIQRLNGRHSRTFGIKSIIFCPSRELALQILKVGKELARGWKSDPGEGQDTRGEAIRWAMIVGGEGMDEQFALMANNPDVVIATPGRMLHLTVEMNLDLKAVEYVVFDEADRLFEMGFAEQLDEMLLRLPPTRQTLLFSATLPKQLVEFARAGLQANPKLVRLDADSKISSELRMAFFSVKPSEKDAALLVLLRDVIGVPYGEQADRDEEEEALAEGPDSDGEQDGQGWKKGKNKDRGGYKKFAGKKRKRPSQAGNVQLLPHQTIIFAATKHHVEYLLLLCTTAGFACSHIYSSLDQATRGIQMSRFRRGQTSLLIVTDVAARGIDLPVLEHVVNYDFPPQPRTFVHRVGRTARAGRKGFAWSFCTNAELPYLCDLQLFLARPLVSSHTQVSDEADAAPIDLHDRMTLGTFPRDKLDTETEYIANSLTYASSSTAVDFPQLKQVAERAQGKYERSISKASQESYRRAKEMVKAGEGKLLQQGEVPEWALAGTPMEELAIHDVILRPTSYGLKPLVGDAATAAGATALPTAGAAVEANKKKRDLAKEAAEAAARAALLAKVNSFRPGETIFEIGARGDSTPLAQLMKSRRRTLDDKAKKIDAAEARKRELRADKEEAAAEAAKRSKKRSAGDDDDGGAAVELEEAGEEEIEALFDTRGNRSGGGAGGEDDEDEDEASSGSDSDDKPSGSGGNAGRRGGTKSAARSRGNQGGGGGAKKSKTTPTSFKDPNFYLSYHHPDTAQERGYSLSNGGSSGGSASFLQQARTAAYDVAGDDSTFGTQIQRPNAARWDTKKKKFIQGDGVGADNKKMIRTESGLRLPASFRSGRFEEWKKEKRIDLPKVGEVERSNPSSGFAPNAGGGKGGDGQKYRHTSFTAPKRLDPLAKNYHKKLKLQQQKDQTSSLPPHLAPDIAPSQGEKNWKRRKVNVGTRARNEIKSAKDILKQREIQNKRKEKNARPSKKSGGGAKKGRR
ncbi:ATP-dependent RNA helicase dbp10 [Thecaphora frezii]